MLNQNGLSSVIEGFGNLYVILFLLFFDSIIFTDKFVALVFV